MYTYVIRTYMYTCFTVPIKRFTKIIRKGKAYFVAPFIFIQAHVSMFLWVSLHYIGLYVVFGLNPFVMVLRVDTFV